MFLGSNALVAVAHYFPHQSIKLQVGEFELRTADFQTLLQVSDGALKKRSCACPRLHFTPQTHHLVHQQLFYRLPPPAAPLAGEYLADMLE
jgi:hypothetical protein